MEPDRYQQSHFSYIAGVCCLFLSLGLFAFSLYLLPYLFFDWQYNVPQMITDFSAMLQSNYAMSTNGIAWVICLGLFLPAVILFIVADVLSNKIDKQIYGMQPEKKPKTTSPIEGPATTESKGLVFKIVMMIVVIFIVAQFFHWVISSST
ncbi:MAG: hypothetical protein CK424_08650 [Legionella sp.]|nr:MAG: hypothetical protein CK424_08650 [Legionella sp.]